MAELRYCLVTDAEEAERFGRLVDDLVSQGNANDPVDNLFTNFPSPMTIFDAQLERWNLCKFALACLAFVAQYKMRSSDDPDGEYLFEHIQKFDRDDWISAVPRSTRAWLN